MRDSMLRQHELGEPAAAALTLMITFAGTPCIIEVRPSRWVYRLAGFAPGDALSKERPAIGFYSDPRCGFALACPCVCAPCGHLLRSSRMIARRMKRSTCWPVACGFKTIMPFWREN